MLKERDIAPGLLFVLVGPPGVGKNALMQEVLPRVPDLRQLPTATTRPIRPTEQPGREHLFVSEAEFKRMQSSGELVESQVVHQHWYGVPRTTVENAIHDGQDLIADIEVLGATILKSAYPDNVILIFVQPKSPEVLIERMRARGEAEAQIELRMQRVPMEMSYAVQCDYLITNDLIGPASELLYAIVLAERSKGELRQLKATNLEKQV